MSEKEATMGESTGRPFYTRLAIGGLITVVATMVVIGIVQLGSGDTSNVAFLVINVGVAVIVAGLIWRSGSSWALVLGAIAGLLGLGMVYGPYLATAINSFNSIFDFGAGVVATVASIVALVGSVVALVQIRRGRVRVEATAVERNTLRGVAVVVAVMVVVSGVVTLAGRDTVTAAERAGAIELLMRRTEFKTTELDAKAGETLRLVLKNNDLYIHTFTIDELDIDVTIGPRGEKALELTPPTKGTFEYRCTIAGHEPMTGTLDVS